jgi:hypothetical protein
MQSMAGCENLSEICSVMKTSALKNDITLIIYISLEKWSIIYEMEKWVPSL